MKPSPDCISLIKKFEGCRLKSYKCPAGIWTIGYGHTGPEVVEGLEINQADADAYLAIDVEAFSSSVAKIALRATQQQFDALVSFAFNVGANALKKSTLLRLHNAGSHESAAAEFMRWNKAGGVVLAGLTRRRKAEAVLYSRKG